jgi:hypothetical protein
MHICRILRFLMLGGEIYEAFSYFLNTSKNQLNICELFGMDGFVDFNLKNILCNIF